MSVEGIREDVAHRIVKRTFPSDPEAQLEKVEQCRARILTYLDPSYPNLLRETASPPALLYVKGREIPPDGMFVAVVGSRNPTPYGLRAAETIGLGLAARSVGVVSGLARGIDAAAHRGCLRGKGFTVAVLGTGIDVVYPSSNQRLFEQIAECGTVLTEFSMGSPPEPKHFPIRNRIISGLSRGVVVVEATKRSGSLITASFALDQGRDVFAVPGSIDSFKSTGTHHLIKQGAKLVENVDDILTEFGHDTWAEQQMGPRVPDEPPPVMDPQEEKIYNVLGAYPMHIDQIVRAGGMEAGTVLSTLMGMELKGIVRQLPGKMFVR
jgi:DNA processing protein